MPMKKADYSTHYNRYIFDLNSDIQYSILYQKNTREFITVYVKDGKPLNNLPKKIKEASKLTEKEQVDYTKQIWRIPIPGKNDIAFGDHSAIIPEETVYCCVRLFTYVGDVVMDPLAGSGTTLKVAREEGRNFIGYEVMSTYKKIIEGKYGEQNLTK